MLLSCHRCNSYSLFLTIPDPPRLTGSQDTTRCFRDILVSLKIPPKKKTKKGKKNEAQRSDSPLSAWPRVQESQQQEGRSWPCALRGPAESPINSAGTKPLFMGMHLYTRTRACGSSAPFLLVLKWSCISLGRRASRDGLIDGSWLVNG